MDWLESGDEQDVEKNNTEINKSITKWRFIVPPITMRI